MKAGESGTSLKQVIETYYGIKIDDYQRPYSWKEEQIEDFFGDLKDASEPNSEDHFFGTLILQQEEDGQKFASLVDGQQRLTTFFLTVAAIRDELWRLSEREIPRSGSPIPKRPYDDCINLLLDPGSTNGRFRFRPNRFAKEIIDKCAFAEPDKQDKLRPRGNPSTGALRKGIRKIRESLSEVLSDKSEVDKLHTLDRLLDTLLHKFFVLKIETTSLSESLDVYLTLNDRGTQLGPTDIVKGKLMMALGAEADEEEQIELQERINIDWDKLIADVVEPETFMRHFLISTGKEKVQKKKVVDFVEKRLRASNDSSELEAADKFWSDLKISAGHYRDLVGVDTSKNDDISYHLALLEGLQKSHRIFLLAVFERPDLREDPPVLSELVRLTFVLSYRWAIEDKSRQGIEDKFHELAQSCRGFTKESETVKPSERLSGDQLIEKLKTESEDIEVNFEKAFRREADGGFICRAVLHYAQRLTASNALGSDIKSYHLEHVAPQKATDNWMQMVYGQATEKYIEYDEVITAMGNLTLLDPGLNTKLQNKPFSDKKDEYRKSTLFLTSDLVRMNSWTEELIRQRTEWLIEAFSGVCRARDPIQQIASFADWSSS